VFGFSGECGSPISKRLPFTTNSRKAVNFVRSLDAVGGTPLAPALEEVNRYMQRYRSGGSETQMIILLADGENSCGSVRSVMNKLKQNGIVFRHETIGLGVDSGSDAVRDLKLIAEETGGGYNYARDHREVEEAFTNAVDSMELLDLLGTFGNDGETEDTSDEQKEEKGIMSNW
jgi:Mg-chelatase subunit ChlD